MCIICLEFNKSRDFGDARLMIEAARREVSVISEDHLRMVEKNLKKIQDEGKDTSEELDPFEVD